MCRKIRYPKLYGFGRKTAQRKSDDIHNTINENKMVKNGEYQKKNYKNNELFVRFLEICIRFFPRQNSFIDY